ncbi:hypothetical protein GM679_10405 [Escherichia coli]|nr:hypothetical protein [Escherichia coli]EFD0954967.1 hypothetical protein [Escherichia coli]EFF9470305.1 hypothetical protein [Escherichia coli]EFH3653820.1 hypothetical protein [Escherichia coli]EFH7389795.1 hypothetical protein [Escherichia coli]
MNKLQSYFIASVLYVMTPHAFAQGTVTIYLPGEQQTLSVGPVENYGPISTICALPCAIRQNRHINLRLNLKDCSTPR